MKEIVVALEGLAEPSRVESLSAKVNQLLIEEGLAGTVSIYESSLIQRAIERKAAGEFDKYGRRVSASRKHSVHDPVPGPAVNNKVVPVDDSVEDQNRY
jgi:hypothetical protein